VTNFRMQFDNQARFAEHGMEVIREAIGKTATVSVASQHLDWHEATDVVFKVRSRGRVAMRLRDYDRYFNKYGNEFTVRYSSEEHRSEFHKIVAGGYAHWMVYGFADLSDQNANVIRAGRILDLDVFRNRVVSGLIDGKQPRPVPNSDGRTQFVPYSVNDFAGLVLHDWGHQ